LGLPIARDLARAMGGELDVASVPGSGSSFVLALPGPASVADGVLETIVERTLAAEEIALEERGLLRVLRRAPRTPVAAPDGQATDEPDPADGPTDDATDPIPRLHAIATTGARRAPSEPRTVRLRTIEGGSPLRSDRAPA